MAASSQEPSVSVVVPAYRQAAFIHRCLDSVARQTYRGPVEVIVVDDGCPENTGAIAEQHPSRPRVIRQENQGVAMARNRGIAEATGEYVAFLDADDFWHGEKLEKQMTLLTKGGPALSFTRHQRVDPEGKPLPHPPDPSLSLQPSLRRLLAANFIGCSTVVCHRKCLEHTSGFPNSPEFRRGGQDYALWLAIAARYPFVYVPEVLVDYTIHPSSRVGSDPLKNFLGAAYGLRWFRELEPSRLSEEGSYRGFVLRRAWRMFGDLARARSEPASWVEGVRATWQSLSG